MGGYICPVPVGHCALFRVRNGLFGIKAGALIVVDPKRKAVATDLILAEVDGELRIARYHDDCIEFADGSLEVVHSTIGVIVAPERK